jgi:hypothetical protein
MPRRETQQVRVISSATCLSVHADPVTVPLLELRAAFGEVVGEWRAEAHADETE